MSLRFETLGQNNLLIPKSSEIETLVWMERCWDKSQNTLKKIPCQKFRGAQFPNPENGEAGAIAMSMASRWFSPLPTSFDVIFFI